MKKTAAILLSRQPMRPSGKTLWIQKAGEAMQWVCDNNLILSTSVGMSTWELLVALAKQKKVMQKVFIPVERDETFHEKCRFTAQQFGLTGELAEFVPVLPDSNSTLKKDLMQKRDRLICEKSDTLVPVSVRNNGYIAQLVSEFSKKYKLIEDRFTSDYEKRTVALSYYIEDKHLTESIKKIKEGQYLIHWTRTANSAWPTEHLIDYYRAIVESDRYPRSAMDTLLNIISTKKLVASSHHMPQNIATVSFTSLSPCEIIPLIRWRARFLQMSFEPYGVGIKSDYAFSCGIQPVQYGQKKSKSFLNKGHIWLTQSTGRKSDWSIEKEYRCCGDFDLSRIPSDKLICFCLTKYDAEKIKRNYHIDAVNFT